MHQNFSEIEALPFYELELLIEFIKNRDKENAEAQKNEQNSVKEMQDKYKMPKVSMPKMPKIPKI